MYGMPHASKRIVKYNPGNGITSFVYEEANKDFRFGNGALGRYWCIYSAAHGGELFKIDTKSNSHCIVGSSVEVDHDNAGWGDAIWGVECCIYLSPMNANRILSLVWTKLRWWGEYTKAIHCIGDVGRWYLMRNLLFSIVQTGFLVLIHWKDIFVLEEEDGEFPRAQSNMHVFKNQAMAQLMKVTLVGQLPSSDERRYWRWWNIVCHQQLNCVRYQVSIDSW